MAEQTNAAAQSLQSEAGTLSALIAHFDLNHQQAATPPQGMSQYAA